ncbi:MAG: Na+ dependent nucleoside transporter N-terminal domain-containing protein, partial [Longimicrobiales bacterium]
MKLSIRSGLVVLWLFAGALVLSGMYAPRTAASAPQRPPPPDTTVVLPPIQRADSLAVMSRSQQQAMDSAVAAPSGPPATGVGGAVGPVDPAAAAAATAQAEQGRSVRRIADIDTPIHQRLVSVLGMITLLFIGWLLSVNRAMIAWRVVLWGLGLQILFALLILKTPVGEAFFTWIN